MSAGGAAAFRMTATATTDPLPPFDLSRISVPTSVMHGSADVIVPPELGRQVAREIPDAKFLLIEGAGHVAHDYSTAGGGRSDSRSLRSLTSAHAGAHWGGVGDG